jgi:sulfur-carrier protein
MPFGILGFQILSIVSSFGFRISNFESMIRVVLPHHLRTLARVGDEVQLDVNGDATLKSVLDALEAKCPMLRGTIRDHDTHKRRSLVRFFACGEDVSHESPDSPLPDAIAKGAEPFFIMGAIAGG